MQRQSKRRTRGTAQALSEWSPVGIETVVLVGTFVSQGPLTELRITSSSSLGPVEVQYRTAPTANRCLRAGAAAHPSLRRGHPRITSGRARVQRTGRRAVGARPLVRRSCIQGGEVAKVLRAGDEWPIVDTSLDITVDEDSEIGLEVRFVRAEPVRGRSAWRSSSSSVRSPSPPVPVVRCAVTLQGRCEDFTLSCPGCPNVSCGCSAELLFIEHC